VLSQNKKMLDLMTSLSFSISNDPEDTSVKHVEARL